MTLITRPDLFCPYCGCKAAITELRERDGNQPSQYKCATHGLLAPPSRPFALTRKVGVQDD